MANLTVDRAEALARAEHAVLGEIHSSSEAYDNLAHLCDIIGDRFAGSASEREGAVWLRDRAAAYGLRDPRLQTFAHTGWTRGPVSVRIIDPVDRAIEAISLPYTPAADFEGEAIWVGQGEQDDYDRLSPDACQGKIVVSWAESTPPPGGHASHRREKTGRALAAGAKAFLFVNQNPGMMAITGSLTAGFVGELPALGLPRESGDYLRRLIERGTVRLRFSIASTFGDTTSHNVLADLGPTTRDGAYLIASAHYDAHDIAVGATDNTSGTVVVLEAARALKKVEDLLPVPIRVILFACEEIGLLGAWHYAKHQAADLDRCRFVLNVDSPVKSEPGSESLSTCGFPELVPYFERLGQELHYEFEVKDRISGYADHFPFSVAGVPSGTLGSKPVAGMVGRGWGHTAADTVDKVNPKSLQAAAALVARLLLRAAYDAEFPGRHRTKAEMDATIDASPIGWYVRRFGRYPFQPTWA
ncbi:MAG: M20/M25/M40 family metallo-hydrolase [Chloroflexota bacterium]|nr:MAG: M20/M25/M40 family metallo-hydrolase [Chloroflexota bacterium]